MKRRSTDPVALSQRVVDDNRHLIQQLSTDLDSARSELLLAQDRIRRLENELRAAAADAAGARTERDELAAGLDQFRRERDRTSAQIGLIENQNTHLANLYVACYHLLGALDRHGVVEAIKEVLINMVGTEDFAVVELLPDGLAVLGGFGPHGKAEQALTGIPAEASAALAAEQSWFAPDPAGGFVACVPLRVGGSRTIGALMIFGLLQQKARIEERDMEMLDLLSTHAANALHFTAPVGAPALDA